MAKSPDGNGFLAAIIISVGLALAAFQWLKAHPIVLALPVCAILLWLTFRPPKRAGDAKIRVTAPYIQCDGDYNQQVVGESHYQRALKALAGDHGNSEGANTECRAVLTPDPDNVYDKNAVRVEIGGRVVGYLSRDDAPHYRAWLKTKGWGNQAITCNALIVGGFDMGGKSASYGVRLDLPEF